MASPARPAPRSAKPYALAGAAVVVISCAIAFLAERFDHSIPLVDRPILWTLGLFTVVGVLTAIAVALAKGVTERSTLRILFVVAVLSRLPLLVSVPILEVDLYRYLWDGNAVANGVSPYRYAPAQVVSGLDRKTTPRLEPSDFETLVDLAEQYPSLRKILTTVHFPELPTVYPSVSQLVFVSAAVLTPDAAPVRVHIIILKCVLLAFDLWTLWLIVRLLQLGRIPVRWAIVYGWSPLVLKEFANSGHLDTITIALTTAALFVAGRQFFGNTTDRRKRVTAAAWSGLLLGLGVGAKIYPVVLGLLLAASFWRRIGWRSAITFCSTSGAVAVLALLPLVIGQGTESDRDLMTQPNRGNEGLAEFVMRWEIHDFLFMIPLENLTPSDPDTTEPWFVVTPTGWRRGVIDALPFPATMGSRPRAFLLTRILTLGLFTVLMLWFALAAARANTLREWLRFVFLTLAWFWLLQPTQNPWYWCWAMPFVAFGSWPWRFVEAIGLASYLRFWRESHRPTITIGSASMTGQEFYDYVFLWLLYPPLFAALVLITFRRSSAVPPAATATPPTHSPR